MLAEHEPLIAGVDDQGVVVNTLFLEVGEKSAEVVVHTLDASQVLLQVRLVRLPLGLVISQRRVVGPFL